MQKVGISDYFDSIRFGFKIQVDGKNVKSESKYSVPGCKMKAGEHDIVITYHAPGMATGKK